MAVHVFIDNSNIFNGARRTAGKLEPTAHWLAVRVYYKHLFTLLEGSREVATRALAGSVPPGNDDLWNYARDAGYNTDLLKKVENDEGHLGEQGVDEVMHAKIAGVLLDYDPPQELVLATGDGKVSQFGTSFVQQVERAAKRRWSVELWSWEHGLSPNLRAARDAHPAVVALSLLDPFYWKLTFVSSPSLGAVSTIGGTRSLSVLPAPYRSGNHSTRLCDEARKHEARGSS